MCGVSARTPAPRTQILHLQGETVSSAADFQTERPDEDDMEQSQTDDAEFCHLQADSLTIRVMS